MPGASFKGQKASVPAKGKPQGKKPKSLKDEAVLDSEDGILGGFGAGPVLGPMDLYRKLPMSMSGATGAITTKRELGIKLTDFFDYTTLDSTAGGVPQFVNNYFLGGEPKPTGYQLNRSRWTRKHFLPRA